MKIIYITEDNEHFESEIQAEIWESMQKVDIYLERYKRIEVLQFLEDTYFLYNKERVKKALDEECAKEYPHIKEEIEREKNETI